MNAWHGVCRRRCVFISTRKKVARLAEVSEATVSRVMNNIGPIREETRRRVLEAAAELDYHPNENAKNFALNRSNNIGVILPLVGNVKIFSTFYFSEILSGIGVEINKRGYDLLLLFREPGEPIDYSTFFKRRKVDGCIILGAQDTPEENVALQELASSNYPFCLVNQHFEGRQFNEIDADHQAGSYMAVKHLIEEGHRNIALLNGPLAFSNSRDRLRGYMQAMKEANLPIRDEFMYTGNFSRTSGLAAIEEMRAYLADIDAVFATNDRMAIGLIQGFRMLDDVDTSHIGIAGFDNSDAAMLSIPSLTSVQVPLYEMGRLAAAKLLDQVINKTDEHFYEKLPTKLIIRESSLKKSNKIVKLEGTQ